MANEEMIQKHEDNFLAKIAGETPQDEEIRNSTEFWLNEIAKNAGGGGGDEKIYQHRIVFGGTSAYDTTTFIIINRTPTPFDATTFLKYLTSNGYTTKGNSLPALTGGVTQGSSGTGRSIASNYGIYASSGAVYMCCRGWVVSLVDGAISSTLYESTSQELFSRAVDNVTEI